MSHHSRQQVCHTFAPQQLMNIMKITRLKTTSAASRQGIAELVALRTKKARSKSVPCFFCFICFGRIENGLCSSRVRPNQYSEWGKKRIRVASSSSFVIYPFAVLTTSQTKPPTTYAPSFVISPIRCTYLPPVVAIPA